MNQYLVKDSKGITIASGILLLTAAQGNARAHALANLGEGLYEIRQPVQFKHGEVIGYDGDINKTLLERIVEVTAVKEETLPASKKAKNEILHR